MLNNYFLLVSIFIAMYKEIRYTWLYVNNSRLKSKALLSPAKAGST